MGGVVGSAKVFPGVYLLNSITCLANSVVSVLDPHLCNKGTSPGQCNHIKLCSEQYAVYI